MARAGYDEDGSPMGRSVAFADRQQQQQQGGPVRARPSNLHPAASRQDQLLGRSRSSTRDQGGGYGPPSVRDNPFLQRDAAQASPASGPYSIQDNPFLKQDAQPRPPGANASASPWDAIYGQNPVHRGDSSGQGYGPPGGERGNLAPMASSRQGSASGLNPADDTASMFHQVDDTMLYQDTADPFRSQTAIIDPTVTGGDGGTLQGKDSTAAIEETAEEIEALRARLAAAEEKKTQMRTKQNKKKAGIFSNGIASAFRKKEQTKGPEGGETVIEGPPKAPCKVEVTVYKATSVIGVSRKGTSDPFTTVLIPVGGGEGPKKAETTTILKEANPKWNERFSFALEPPDKSARAKQKPFTLAFVVSSRGFNEDFLGYAQVDVPVPDKHVLESYTPDMKPLTARPQNKRDEKFYKKYGHLGYLMVSIRTQYAPGVSIPDLPRPTVVEISVVRAEGLKPDNAKSCSIYVELKAQGLGLGGARVKGMPRRTRTEKNTIEPDFDERFTYPYDGDSPVTLLASVYDEQRGKEPAYLGSVSYKLEPEVVGATVLAPKKIKLGLGGPKTNEKGTEQQLAQLIRRAKRSNPNVPVDKLLTTSGVLGFLLVTIRAAVVETYAKAARFDTDRGRPGGGKADESDEEDERPRSVLSENRDTGSVGSMHAPEIAPIESTLSRKPSSSSKSGTSATSASDSESTVKQSPLQTPEQDPLPAPGDSTSGMPEDHPATSPAAAEADQPNESSPKELAPASPPPAKKAVLPRWTKKAKRHGRFALPLMTAAEGAESWVRADTSPRGGHPGVWRSSEYRMCCSTPAAVEGPLCAHDGGVIAHDHWSCCGQKERHVANCEIPGEFFLLASRHDPNTDGGTGRRLESLAL
ncbi:Rabphilin-1 [Diplonema papillatum]|nr:Rabphilin-1 [Diplonema papillatum]